MLTLYIGGYAQNKLELVKARWPHGIVCQSLNVNDADGCIIINDFHLIVRDLLLDGKSPDDILLAAERLVGSDGKSACSGKEIIIISDEIGSGIVPVEKFEREWREITGRILCVLARRAERVIRLVCGIEQVIKE